MDGGDHLLYRDNLGTCEGNGLSCVFQVFLIMSKFPPPPWDGKTSYLQWRKELIVWSTVADGPDGRLTGQVMLALQGSPRTFALHYAESLLVAENSLKKLLDLLDSEY